MTIIALDTNRWQKLNLINYQMDSSSRELLQKEARHYHQVARGETFSREKHTIFSIDGKNYFMVRGSRPRPGDPFRSYSFVSVDQCPENKTDYTVDLLAW